MPSRDEIPPGTLDMLILTTLSRSNEMHGFAATRSLEQVALLGGMTMNLTGAGAPERLSGARVSPVLFSMLGIRAQLGRTFVEADDHPGQDRVVVLNDELRRRRFNADPRVIGRTITLDDNPYEIVGVLASGFHFRSSPTCTH